jgi:tRNA-uridine 2-sulfurtransferase
MTKAIALLSGGLDSTLAILAVIKQGIEVKAIQFVTPFDIEVSDISSALKDPYPLGGRFGFDVEVRRLGDKFLDMVKNPKHGYGKNMNPCIDCRILMLKEAKELMQKTGAEFIVTGEVLGQRPMSQKKDMLYHIDKEACVVGSVLRPLCAKLLRITIPEEKGIVNGELLYAFNGRSRKPQMALAKEFGLEDYPLPAGGCRLTDPVFSLKLKDFLKFNPSPAMKDIELMKVGRHFRLSPTCQIVVGRDESENELIQSLASKGDCLLKVEDCGSPTTLIIGGITDERVRIAASICARYSDAKNRGPVDVSVKMEGNNFIIRTIPADDIFLNNYRLNLSKQNKPIYTRPGLANEVIG